MQKRRLLSLLLCLALVVSLFSGLSALASATGAETTVPRAEEDALVNTPAQNPKAEVHIIVELKDAPAMDLKNARLKGAKNFSASSEARSYRSELLNDQESVQDSILAINPDVTFKYGYTNLLNGFFASVQAGDLEAIRNLPDVKGVYLAGKFKVPTEDLQAEENLAQLLEELNADPALDPEATVEADESTIEMINVQPAWNAGYTGKGKVIAVFDSGIRFTHEAFSNIAAYPGQQTMASIQATLNANRGTLNMFKTPWPIYNNDLTIKGYNGFSPTMQQDILDGGFYRNQKVPFGVNYADCNLAVFTSTGMNSSHGTHVSGIAAANEVTPQGTKIKGVAPDAQIFSYRIFSATSSWGYDEDVIAALDDAVTIGADAFNLSIGDTSGYADYTGDLRLIGFDMVFSRARAAGINVAVSSGNSGHIRTGGLGNNASSYAKYPDMGTVGSPGTNGNMLTVASTQNLKTMTFGSFLTVEGIAGLEVFYIESNSPAIASRAAFNDVPVGFVDCGYAAAEADVPAAVAGKVALVKRGSADGSSVSFVTKQENVLAKGAIACIVYNNVPGAPISIAPMNGANLPLVSLTDEDGRALVDALVANANEKIRFKAGRTKIAAIPSTSNPGQVVAGSSWGVTPELVLKPDITAPGSGILSTGYQNDSSYVNMSGTSMASPHVAGAYPVVQQYIEDHFASRGLSGAAKADLVEHLIQSTATIVPFYSSSLQVNNTRFVQSPRWQGAGAMNLGAVIENEVILYNTYNRKTKVELGDKLNNTFTITLNAQNLGTKVYAFNVWGYCQTDGVTPATATTPALIDTTPRPLMANMRVRSVTGGGLIVYGTSNNVNRYVVGPDSDRPCIINVNPNSTATITVEVTLPEMAPYTADFVNGLFVEGFIEFADAYPEENEGAIPNPTLSLPYVGFYGDWLKAPAIDPGSLYEEIAPTDPNYPFYYENSLRTIDADANKTTYILGRNTFANPKNTPAETNSDGTLRQIASQLRTSGNLKKDYIAFSPNGDGHYDNVYGYLNLIRNVRLLTVTIEKPDGTVVRTVGKKDYARKSDKNPNGQYYFTNLQDLGIIWDGKDQDGALLAEGTYTYKLTGISPYANAASAPHTWSLPVVLDVTLPVMDEAKLNTVEDKRFFDFKLSDNHVLMAYEVFYDGAAIGEPTIVNAATANGHIDVTTYAAASGFDPAKLTVKAYDYAGNIQNTAYFELEESTADVAVGKTRQLHASVTDNIAWLSANPAFVTVNTTGVLTGVAAGNTNVTATRFGYTLTCAVRVFDMQDMYDMIDEAEALFPDENLYTPESWSAMIDALEVAQDIKGNPVSPTYEEYTAARDNLRAAIDALVKKTIMEPITDNIVFVRKGGRVQLGVKITPPPPVPITFVWSSSNPAVASVSATGLVTTYKVGTALITAKAQDGSGRRVDVTLIVNLG